MSATRSPSQFYASSRGNRSSESTPVQGNGSRTPHRSSSHGPLDRSASTNRTQRQNTVIVTSEETDRMFDCFNSITRALKSHKLLLENITTSQKNLQEEVQSLREENKAIQEKMDDLVEQEHNDDGKIPPEISNNVHLLHNALELDKQYRPSERIVSPHNAAVRRELEEQIFDQEKGYPTRYVKRAVVRYYETKRKQFLQSLPENKEKAAQQKAENKLRSRRKRLCKARAKVAEGVEKKKIDSLTYDYVSDEENSTEGAGKWVVRPPAWRSEEASALMQKLQQKVEAQRMEDRPRVPRVLGSPSKRPKPRLFVSWAIKEPEAEDNPRVSPTGNQQSSPERMEARSSSSERGFDSPRDSSRSPSPIQKQVQQKKKPRSVRERRSKSRSRSPPSIRTSTPVKVRGQKVTSQKRRHR